MDKSTAQKKMNALGAKRTPFLFVIDFEMVKPKVLTIPEAMNNNVYFDINGLQKWPDPLHQELTYKWEKTPIPFPVYEKAFELVMKHILHGNSYLLNLTYPTLIKTDLSLESLFLISKAKYKLCFPDDFLVFSPETFIRIKDTYIFTYPMKGTADASIQDAAAKLLNDQKELSEHYTIVDLMRNDLSIIADHIEVTRFRYLEKIGTASGGLYQTSSEIKGELESRWHYRIGDILFSMLPAGSVTGAPKKKTVEIITAAEIGPRGFYTGVFGYFDGYSLDSSVMIRYIEKESGRLFFRSGGGITAQSQVEMEYRELIDKVYVPVS